MRSLLTALTALAATGIALPSAPASAAQGSEAARVIREACGEAAEPDCVDRLRKVCRGKVTFRCYYARKRRIDGADSLDTHGKAGEGEDHSIFYDE